MIEGLLIIVHIDAVGVRERRQRRVEGHRDACRQRRHQLLARDSLVCGLDWARRRRSGSRDWRHAGHIRGGPAGG